MDNRNSITRPFGEPIDAENWAEIVDMLTDIGEDDAPDAIDWFDQHASEKWRGCLDNPPIGVKKR